MENNNWNSVGTVNKTFEDKIDSWYFHFWLWTVIGLPFLLIVIGIIPLLVATVFECFILYHAWKAIPNNPWQVPPILAVLLVFAPVVGAIWAFWVYWLMSQEMNRELAKKGNAYRTDEALIFIYCVLYSIVYAFMSIPMFPTITIIIGVIVGIPASIVGIFAIRSIKNGVLVLHRYESV